MVNREITKENLDDIYNLGFDSEEFKQKDPCGIVYELMKHTDNQLDIEIGALLTAMIAWGNRKAIRSAALTMLRDEMNWHPAHFILSHAYEQSYANAKNNCVYRTLNVDTFKQICSNIADSLQGFSTIEEMIEGKSSKDAIAQICRMLEPAKVGTMDKSACKRVCMYFRWMTRHQAPDMGLWKNRSEADLYAVMDVHVCDLTMSILKNKRPTWKAVVELTDIFKSWDSTDPLKYDIALMTLSDRIDEEEKIINSWGKQNR